MPRNVAVEAEDLIRRFNSFTAVDRLSFRVDEGEVFGFLGPNGAGKTTTVRMLACLLSPSEGSCKIGGYDVSREPLKVREIVGLLTENPSLYEKLTAYENMDFFAEAYGLTDLQEKKSRIAELLEFFDLWERRNDKAGTFSKGMKQKLAIARALVHRPPVILLDEPTSGLDPESARSIRDLIKKLSSQDRSTILLCTHRLEDAEKLCSRVMIVNQGRSIIVGSITDLANRMGGQKVLLVTLKDTSLKTVEAVGSLPHVKEVVQASPNQLTITVDDFDSVTPLVVKSIVESGGMILTVNPLIPSLEDAYLKLIKEAKH
ncbi:MAG: ABC transporter ATP-binding protein [Thaumarchaeota archaeon]|nr:ABC transporter ATP-binding protein [Nitrososphaerota archaeon]